MASCGSCLEKRPQAVVRRIMSASGIPRWRYFAAVRARKGVRTASCRKRLGNVRKPLLPISMTVRDVAELGSLFYGRESEKERADSMTSCRSCLEKRPQAVAARIHIRERCDALDACLTAMRTENRSANNLLRCLGGAALQPYDKNRISRRIFPRARCLKACRCRRCVQHRPSNLQPTAPTRSVRAPAPARQRRCPACTERPCV